MSNQLYKFKQDWIEAVMADPRLTPAMARYAFGIQKHMFGNKTTSYPGAKALSEATSLNDSQFYKYNQALVDAGYVEYTPGEGTSNHYTLVLPTSIEGTHLPSEEVDLPSEEVGGTSIEGTNTTKKPTRKTTMETYKDESNVASAPNDSCGDSSIKEVKEDAYVYMGTLRDEDFEAFPNLKGTLAYDYLANSEGVASSLIAPREPRVEFEVAEELPPLREDKERVDGLEHLERLLRSRNISEDGQQAARARYDDPEYRPGVRGMQRAGWIIGDVAKV